MPLVALGRLGAYYGVPQALVAYNAQTQTVTMNVNGRTYTVPVVHIGRTAYAEVSG